MHLDNIVALNNYLDLTTERKLVPFDPLLLKLMNLRKYDRIFPDYISNYDEIMKAYMHIGKAWCGVAQGKPVCAFGIIPLWKGVAEIWMLTDEELPKYIRTFHRVTKQMFDLFFDEYELNRLQCTVHSLNGHGVKWIEALYFEQEGRLKKYGPDGKDFFMYGRLKNGRHTLIAKSSKSSRPRPRTAQTAKGAGGKSGGKGTRKPGSSAGTKKK